MNTYYIEYYIEYVFVSDLPFPFVGCPENSKLQLS